VKLKEGSMNKFSATRLENYRHGHIITADSRISLARGSLAASFV
jgi:hypothetical protein